MRAWCDGAPRACAAFRRACRSRAESCPRIQNFDTSSSIFAIPQTKRCARSWLLVSLPHYGTRNQLIDRAYTAGLTIGMRRSRNILPLDHEELPLGLDVTEAIPKDSASPASSAAGAVPKASPRSSPRAADETDANDGCDDEIVDGVWGAGKAEKINILICRECLVSNPTGGAFPYCGRCGKNSAYVPLWHPTSTRLPGPPQQDSDLFPIYKQLALATITDLRRLLAIFNLARNGL